MMNNSLDACLQLVADQHRRRAIHYLRRNANGTTTFDDLVDQLHGKESVSEGDLLHDREQLAIQLQHTHLPKLADYGVVEYDHRNGTIQYRPDDRVEAVLDSLPEEALLPDL